MITWEILKLPSDELEASLAARRSSQPRCFMLAHWTQSATTFVRALNCLRSRRLAHFDVPVPEPLAELEYGEFMDVLEILWMCSVALYRALHQVAAVSDDRVREARAHTGEIHRILVAHRRNRLMLATS
ncbi:MAG: hypothetical protein OXG95_09730 [Chloroflexi bacterium]|nr:hypothetical protein [Chloroflexota bacterium]